MKSKNYKSKCGAGLSCPANHQQKGQIMHNKNQLFIIRNDDNKIVFCGNLAQCFDNFLLAGNNYLKSSQYQLFDFAGNLCKTITTKR